MSSRPNASCDNGCCLQRGATCKSLDPAPCCGRWTMYNFCQCDNETLIAHWKRMYADKCRQLNEYIDKSLERHGGF